VHELELLREKLRYLARGAAVVVFAGTLPRGVEPRFYSEAIRELNRLGVETVLDADGEPLVLGAEAEPFLVSPNQREAEALAGHEFEDDQDFVAALDAIADLGPRNVLITTPTGCFALVREDRAVRRLHAVAPRVEPVSPVGSGDVLLAGFLAARYAERTAEDALRTAVATGAAATLEVGAGRFDQREVARLAASVTVVELDRVAA
jgi:1-phosphofructokinase/tagatose 6-phosphate kinase